MVKKGFMKILEVLLSVMTASVFLLVIVPNMISTTGKDRSFDILVSLERDERFRNEVISRSGCFDSNSSEWTGYIEGYLPREYDYHLCVNNVPLELPDKTIIGESVFIAGNITAYNPKRVRLYYWLR